MHRITLTLILLCSLTFLPIDASAAWPFGDDPLVTIDGNEYAPEEFKRWWNFWKEKDEALPETPEPYIDWLLLAREGERMELDEDPGFKRQTRIFLQARGLLKLKYEEVDSQIEVSEADIEKRYREKFLPRWYLQRLEFQDEEAALEAWDQLQAEALTVKELLEKNHAQGGPLSTSENWVRPVQLDPGWVAIFEKTPVGQVVDPEEHNRGFDLFYIRDKKGFDENDLAQVSERIRSELWKEKEDELTQALLRDLREKYEVKVHEDRLAKLDLNADDDSLSDEPIISTTEENISEKDFMAVIDRLISSRPAAAHALSNEEEAAALKENTVNNIIAQSVTNWEALDRHYEEQEPFKWAYQFNYNHRLVKAVENLLFAPKAEVSEEEAKQYYEQNIDDYTRPETAKLYIIDDTQIPVEKIWAEVAVGKNFLDAIAENTEVRVIPQEVPVNHLDEEVRDVAKNLAEGETSRVFNARGSKVMVHMVKKTPENPLPFHRLKDSIRTKIKKQKIKELHDEHVALLKSRSQIEVDSDEWESVREEIMNNES